MNTLVWDAALKNIFNFLKGLNVNNSQHEVTRVIFSVKMAGNSTKYIQFSNKTISPTSSQSKILIWATKTSRGNPFFYH